MLSERVMILMIRFKIATFQIKFPAKVIVNDHQISQGNCKSIPFENEMTK